MAVQLDRRTALIAGVAFAAGTLTGAASAATRQSQATVLLFDPAVQEARALAGAANGPRLVAVAGDPMRLWRQKLAGNTGPIRGITRWSDYLVLRGLAEEQGLRVRREEQVETAGGPMILDWSMA